MCLDDSPYFRMLELDETDSTNNFLKGYRPLTPVDITLVTAEYQSAGRGQVGNSWESERSQNLLFSLLLSACPVPSSQLFAISEAIALSIREALLAFTPQSAITVKWPNDIYVDDRKIAGILIENDLQGTHISRSIVGCGVNVNQASFLFPTLATTMSDGQPSPTPVSLFQLLGHATERRFVLEAIMEHFMHYYAHLQRGTFDALHASYHDALYRSSGLHSFRDADGPFRATIEGVAPTGHLLLRDTDQRLRRYAFKEVRFC